jgi:hypothetical protein
MDKNFFEKTFSEKRMEKYFRRYADLEKAMLHYQCNIELAEAFYPCITTFEVALRNAAGRELTALFGKEDWYVLFAATPGLTDLNKYIAQANKQIAGRKEYTSPSKIIAELTLGFWVSLFKSNTSVFYGKVCVKFSLTCRKKNVSEKKVAPQLNRFRTFRNRIFHHEPISWNLERLRQIHVEMLTVMMWINKDIPAWLAPFDRFDSVCNSIEQRLR